MNYYYIRVEKTTQRDSYMTDTEARKRANRSKIFSYLLHVVLRNAEYQGKKKSFNINDTKYEEFGICKGEAWKVMRELSLTGAFQKAVSHPRKWSITEDFRQRLTETKYEQLEVVAEKLSDVFRQDLAIKLSKSNLMDEQVAEALGLKAVYGEGQ